MDYHEFDISSWSRQSTFLFYKDFDDPFFNVTVHLSVDTILKESRESNHSFFYSCMHCCLSIINEIENFKLRFKEDTLVLVKTIHGGSTILYDDGSFGFAYYNYNPDRNNFCDQASITAQKQKDKKNFDPQNDRIDLVYFSSMPWINFTGVKHAKDSRVNRSIPLISFGKYYEREGKTFLPVNVEVNHALMDGYHLGLFIQRLQKQFDENQNMLH